MAKAEPNPPARRRWLYWLVLGTLGVAAAGAGAALPHLLGGGSHTPAAPAAADHHPPVFVPFGEVVVNLAEERLTRYLRVKLVLMVDAADEKAFTELLARKKAILKTWLISYLSDKSLREVSGAAGVNRARREIQDQFNALLYSDGSEKVRDVLFEEFVVQ